jgi:ketosteroid isomerase-like protein
MRYLKLAVFLLIAGVIILGCKSDMDIEKLKQSLIKADKEFCQTALEKGVPAAFIAYADEQAVIYKDKTHPIEGRTSIEKAYASAGGVTLSWDPTFVDVAASGDLGYTLGEWVYTAADSSMSKGYYISIWKKQADGKWKYVFDSGIEAPKE